MSDIEIVGLIVSILGIGCFAALFTILYMTYSNSTINEYKTGKRDIELIDEAIYDNLSYVKKRKKIFQTIKSIGFYGLMIIIIPFFTLSLINKFSGDITMINNKGIIVVATGSMSKKDKNNDYIVKNNLNNQFDAYEIIVIEKVETHDDLKLYDVISFVNDQGINVIHRIIDIEYGERGIQYETRGDSNNASDKYRPVLEDIQGKYTGTHIPYLGLFILFMQSYIGIITIVSLIYCLFMIDRFTAKITKTQNDRLDILSEVIDYKTETQRGEIKAKYVESIYYKGYIYLFNENGFIDKKEIKDGPYLEESNTSIIKVIEDGTNSEVISKEVIIEENKDVKEGN